MVNSLLKTDLVISLSFFGLLLEHAQHCLWILEGCNHFEMQQVFSINWPQSVSDVWTKLQIFQENESAVFLRPALNIWWIPFGARVSTCVDTNQCVLSLILIGLTPRLPCPPKQGRKTVRTLQHTSEGGRTSPVQFNDKAIFATFLYLLINGNCMSQCNTLSILFLEILFCICLVFTYIEAYIERSISTPSCGKVLTIV